MFNVQAQKDPLHGREASLFALRSTTPKLSISGCSNERTQRDRSV